MINFFLTKIFGSTNDRIIKSYDPIISKINSLEQEISKLSDADLKNKTNYFKEQLEKGKILDDILPEAFAVVREASSRVLKMRHFDVQLIGGIILHQGKISEMKTGEGKTLVSTLPAYLNALSGKSVHIVTVNDYLAKRDSVWMGKIYEFLGLTVGCITNDINDTDRKSIYRCDIIYATNNELGFDYLRDNMKFSIDDMVTNGRHFAIVDEVDSILIDESRSPLVISGPTNDNSELYQKINKLIPNLSKDDYEIDEKSNNAFLTEEGSEKIENILIKNNLIKDKSAIFDPDNMGVMHHFNQALRAHLLFNNNKEYIVKNGNIVIIDEFTGRMQEGRRFSDGLHQALEAKEGLRVKNENQTLSSITFQNYFRLYDKLSGMTGTAITEAAEFEEIYNLKTVQVPTHQKIARIDEDDEIYKTKAEKYKAIVNDIKQCHSKKQPILVGTVTIENSEYISKLLKKEKLPHKVLNAKFHMEESKIISQAGIPGAITIATNMAGRGTDIKLGGSREVFIEELKSKKLTKAKLQEKIDLIDTKIKEDKKLAIEAGGLYVLGTERHESRRIDNQLRGRSGRQGDVGKSKFYLSLEDDLMRIFGSDKLSIMLSKLGLKDDEAIFHPLITKTLIRAQNKVEMHHFEIRKNLLKYDDIVNDQRKEIYKRRMDIIKSNDLGKDIIKIIDDVNQDLIGKAIPKKSYLEQWDLQSVEKEMLRIYGIKLDIKSFSSKEGVSAEEILDYVNENAEKLILEKEKERGVEIEKELRRQIFLMTLDYEWKNHLLALDKMRNNINLRAYAGKDPFIEYKRESAELFQDMIYNIEEKSIIRIAHAKLQDQSNQQEALDKLTQFSKSKKNSEYNYSSNSNILNAKDNQSRNTKNINNTRDKWANVGRNQKCPCGSGLKYKHCHGKIT
jgi:preprotein translocase subunit SecA